MKETELGERNRDDAALRSLMQSANILSYRALATEAGVSRWQVQQLRLGKASQMRVEAIARLAKALKVSLAQLLSEFGQLDLEPPPAISSAAEVSALRQEYQRLQGQMAQQMESARSQFQAEALQTIETWLRLWPTIAKRAEDKGEELPAVKVLAFVRPVEQMVADWGVEAIAPIDAQIPYDPHMHQLKKGTAEPGEIVRVTHCGRLHHGKLLYRAEVQPIN